MPGSLDVPELVRQRAMSNGVAGRRWLDDLPKVVAALALQWGLKLGHSYRGGTAAFVASATDASGRGCVLKVAMPLEIDDPDTFHHASTTCPSSPETRSVWFVSEQNGWRRCVELIPKRCGSGVLSNGYRQGSPTYAISKTAAVRGSSK